MKPLLPEHPEGITRGANGQPSRERQATAPTVPTLPVLQRQRAPQQRSLDLRRR